MKILHMLTFLLLSQFILQVPLKSYFAWALMDNFEWLDGYSKHFGVMYNDRATQKRTMKASARFIQSVFRG